MCRLRLATPPLHLGQGGTAVGTTHTRHNPTTIASSHNTHHQCGRPCLATPPLHLGQGGTAVGTTHKSTPPPAGPACCTMPSPHWALPAAGADAHTTTHCCWCWPTRWHQAAAVAAGNTPADRCCEGGVHPAPITTPATSTSQLNHALATCHFQYVGVMNDAILKPTPCAVLGQ
jgi:hypothetical protein